MSKLIEPGRVPGTPHLTLHAQVRGRGTGPAHCVSIPFRNDLFRRPSQQEARRLSNVYSEKAEYGLGSSGGEV